jgi:hypothetical protein
VDQVGLVRVADRRLGFLNDEHGPQVARDEDRNQPV